MTMIEKSVEPHIFTISGILLENKKTRIKTGKSSGQWSERHATLIQFDFQKLHQCLHNHVLASYL